MRAIVSFVSTIIFISLIIGIAMSILKVFKKVWTFHINKQKRCLS